MTPDASSLPSWETLYRFASGGLLLTDTSGLILRVNQTFCDWLGYQSGELIGQQRFTKLLTIGNQVFCQTHWSPLLQIQGSVGEVKLEFKHRDGHLVPMIVNCARRAHGATELDEIFAIRVLDRHKYEEELVLARRSAEELNDRLASTDRRKDEFLAVLSHELRNPLAPMRNVVEILKRKEIVDPQVLWARAVMGRQLDHMQHLVDDLLEVSRIAQGKIELRITKVDLFSIISDAAEAARPTVERAQHQLNVRLPAVPVMFMGDATRLIQILVNLLNNATKFTPPGGSIELCGEHQDGDIVVSVSDTGIGIEGPQLHSIFEMFTQIGSATQQGGLGIGLALARGLVQLHGGSIEARSEGLGRGSTFTVRIPITPQSSTIAASHSVATRGISAPLNVVIVDDNEDAAISMSILLELSGHCVERARDARVGLALAAKTRPDVLLLDIGLPDMNGYELAKRIRASSWGQEALLIATTGWGQDSDKTLAEAAGFDHHFTKPVNIANLDAILSARAKLLSRG